MRKALILTMSLLLVVAMSMAVFAADGALKDGHYVGYVPNDHGDVVIEVVIERGQIVDVNMLNPFKLHYNYEAGKQAFFEYPYMVLEKQSTEVDMIAGATHSMQDYTEATEMALAIASGAYTGNKYYGVAEDWKHGHVLVEITVEGGKITAARLITANPDLLTEEDGREKLMPAKGDDYKSEAALEYFKTFGDKVVENQGNVDIVAGATHSGESYNAALDMAMEQAGLK
jgi:uncharacterized protein with FMN-binding domain